MHKDAAVLCREAPCSVMVYLLQVQEATIAEISSDNRLTYSWTCEVLNRLEQDQYVSRKKLGRHVMYRLTPVKGLIIAKNLNGIKLVLEQELQESKVHDIKPMEEGD